MGACALFTLFVPEPQGRRPAARPKRLSRQLASRRRWSSRSGSSCSAARAGWSILLFVLFYKFGEAFGGAMANPFYHEHGILRPRDRRDHQGLRRMLATLVGGVLGGMVVARMGLFRTLMIGGVLQAVTNLLFSLPRDARAMTGSGSDASPITADNLAGGVAGGSLRRLSLRPVQSRRSRPRNTRC